ncbi:MAG: hypothetical protein ACRDY7_09100, partial [Acidimicrobiia bacterium]
MQPNGSPNGSGNGSGGGARGHGPAPAERALDMLVARPVGLALLAWQSVPAFVGQLVSKGCAQLGDAETTVRQARTIGQMAVTFGSHQVRKEVEGRVAQARRMAGSMAGWIPGVGEPEPVPRTRPAPVPEPAVPAAGVPTR